MTEVEHGDIPTPEEEEHEVDARYKPPPEKTIEEIVAADQDDESLRKYKEALLGEAKEGKIIVGRKCVSMNCASNWLIYLVIFRAR